MSIAYEARRWVEFGALTAGATATLTGLLFISVSINLQRILEFSNLPARAAQTLLMFVAPFFVGLLVVVPGQRPQVLGGELLALAVVLVTSQLTLDVRGGASEHETTTSRLFARIVPSILPALCFGVAGASLLAHAGGGLYWLVPGVVISVGFGLVNAWVLLIEIQR